MLNTYSAHMKKVSSILVPFARDDAKAKGTLSIIEAEIYESLPAQNL